MTRADFNDFVYQQSRRLYGFAFRILRNQEEAEDAVQEVLIKLWKMDNKLSGYKSIEALATTMIRNYCIDLIRKRKRIYQEEEQKLEFLSMSAPSPLDQMEISESNKIILMIIEKLPDQYRTMIKLRDIDGSSYEEIVERTGQNVNTIRVSISRARKMVRDEYKKYQYERKGTEKITR